MTDAIWLAIETLERAKQHLHMPYPLTHGINQKLCEDRINESIALLKTEPGLRRLDVHILLDAMGQAAKGEPLDPETCQTVEGIAKQYNATNFTEVEIQALYDCGPKPALVVDKGYPYQDHMEAFEKTVVDGMPDYVFVTPVPEDNRFTDTNTTAWLFQRRATDVKYLRADQTIPPDVVERVAESLEIAAGYIATVASGVGKMPILKGRAQSDCEVISESITLLSPYRKQDGGE